jgi:hypothetical protein
MSLKSFTLTTRHSIRVKVRNTIPVIEYDLNTIISTDIIKSENDRSELISYLENGVEIEGAMHPIDKVGLFVIKHRGYYITIFDLRLKKTGLYLSHGGGGDPNPFPVH